jgi:hypothetical protein
MIMLLPGCRNFCGNTGTLYCRWTSQKCFRLPGGEEKKRRKPSYTGEEEFNYFMAVIFPDKDLNIMDYNRVIRDLNSNTPKE